MVSFAPGRFIALKIWDKPQVDSTLGTGETEWAKIGRFTGVTEIDLTPQGVAQVSSAASKLVGVGEVIDPSRLAQVFVSPRKRAKTTFELLSLSDDLNKKAVYTEDIAEWNYGDYEGLDKHQIRSLREQRGLDAVWNIWSDGREGGEYEASFFTLGRVRFTNVSKIASSCQRTPRQIHVGDQRKTAAEYARGETQ